MLTTIVADGTDYNVYSPMSQVHWPTGVASRGVLAAVGFIGNGSPRTGGSTPALTST